MKICSKNFIGAGLFFYILATLIGFASTNSFTLEVIPVVRSVCLIIATVILIIFLTFSRVNTSSIMAFGLATFFFAIGTLLGRDALAFYEHTISVAISFVIVIVGIFFFAHSQHERAQFLAAKLFLFSSSLVLLTLLLTNGLIFDPVPRFVIEIPSGNGEYRRYSQGISKFFGAACITSLWIYKNSSSQFWCLVLVLTSLVFFILSFLGGGRGDFLAAAIVASLIFVSKSSRAIIALIVIGVLLYLLFSWGINYFGQDIVAVKRFMVLSESQNLGPRSVLLGNLVDLISEKPLCVIRGCGYTYFQYFYGEVVSKYPHNIFLESLITWGIFLTLFFVFLFVSGLRRKRFDSWVALLGLFFVLIGMKSGDVIESWFALSFLFFYAGVGMLEIIGKPRALNAQEGYVE